MKGTILDFLELASEKPELAKDLANLAARYNFEFSDEVSDEELEGVAGGSDELGGISEEMSLNLQIAMERRSKIIQTLSNILKKVDSTQDSIVQNIK